VLRPGAAAGKNKLHYFPDKPCIVLKHFGNIILNSIFLPSVGRIFLQVAPNI
jgi:hypothetical protein